MRAQDTRQRVGFGAIFAGCLFSALLIFVVMFAGSASAATGVNQQVNYQARLLDNTGAVVPDGPYNMEFKIYQDGNGVLGGGDETLKWTETRTGVNRVTVKNGYFSVQLGSVNVFGTAIDWNQDTLWLSTNIGGTGGSPVWDGEMSPFRRLGSAAYALNADRLDGLSATDFLQLAPSGVQADSTTNNSIFVNKTGASGNILQLQKNGSNTLTVANSGAITVGTADGNGSLFVLDIKNDTSSDPGGTEGAMYYNDVSNKFRCYQNTGWTDCIGAGGGGGGTLQDAYTNSSPALVTTTDAKDISFNLADTSTDANFVIDLQCDTSCGANGRFAIQNDGTDILNVAPTGAFTYQLPSGTASAFRLLNGGAVPVFVVDTSTTRVHIGNPTADSIPALLVLDSADGAADPTGANGAMYYNSNMHKFRCYENNVWWDCIGGNGERARRKPIYSCDFLDASTNGCFLLGAAVASGTINAPNNGISNSDHPGVVKYRSSTTANSGYRYGGTNSLLVTGGETFELAFNITTLTNGTFRFGLIDTITSTDVVDGAYIEVPSTGAAVCKTASNNTRTTSPTIATLSTATWYRARIKVNSNATSVSCELFNAGGTSLGSQSNAANIPTGAGRETGIGVIFTSSGTTATDLVHLDYLSFWTDKLITR